MLFVGTSIIHPSTEGVFLLCNILDLLIYSNIITSQTYKKGGETIEKKYVFYKPGNIYALYFLRENTLCYNINFSGKTKFIYMIR